MHQAGVLRTGAEKAQAHLWVLGLREGRPGSAVHVSSEGIIPDGGPKEVKVSLHATLDVRSVDESRRQLGLQGRNRQPPVSRSPRKLRQCAPHQGSGDGADIASQHCLSPQGRRSARAHRTTRSTRQDGCSMGTKTRARLPPDSPSYE